VQIYALDALAHHAASSARPTVALDLLSRADHAAASVPSAVPERERYDKQKALDLLVTAARAPLSAE